MGRLALLFLTLPLAAPAGEPLKVFVLAGQSNMQGHARVETFDHIGDDPATAPLLAKMRDAGGSPRTVDGVWISYLTGGPDAEAVSGPLTAGYGARRDPQVSDGKIGPEFTFGIRVRELVEGPVLIIKTAWGGKSLHTDFRPPSAGPFTFSETQLNRFKERGEDRAEKLREKAEATGRYYRLMVDHVQSVLSDPGRVVPDYDAEAGCELAGFVWFQGWNDMVDSGVYPDRGRPGGYDAYGELLTHLIRDVRRDLDAPDLRFVIGVMGVGGSLETIPAKRNRPVHETFREAMAAPAGRLPNVAVVRTAEFWSDDLGAIDLKREAVSDFAWRLKTKHRAAANADGSMTDDEQRAAVEAFRAETITPQEQALWDRGASNAAYHYLGSGKTMALIGEAFAEAAAQPRARSVGE